MSHAPFPPSSAKRWLICTGSFGQGLQLPDPPDSEYSLEGTRLHELAAAYLKPPYEPIMNRNDQLFLKPYIEYTKALIEVADEHYVEHKAWHPTMPDLLNGTPDFVALGDAGWLEVVDLKTGYGIMVEPKENDQLLAYAAIIVMERVRNNQSLPTVVKLTIVQPTDDTNPVKSWTTTIERVLAFAIEAEEAIRSAIGGSTDLVPGEWCRWCKAKPVCPKLRGMVARTQAGELQLLDDMADMPYWLDKADLLEQWLDALRAHGHEYLRNGGSIPGWELKPKRAMRQWDDEEAVLEIARRRKIKIYQDKMLSPAMAERVHKPLPEELTKHIVAISNGTNLVRSTGTPEVTTPPTTPMEQLRANIKTARIRHAR